MHIVVTAGMTVDTAVIAAREAAPRDPEPGTSVMLALNGEYVKGDHVVRAGDEIALIPPVSGGSGDIKTELDWVFVTPDELDPAPLPAIDHCGAYLRQRPDRIASGPQRPGG